MASVDFCQPGGGVGLQKTQGKKTQHFVLLLTTNTSSGDEKYSIYVLA
jgi:hypothetical protein